MSTESKKPRNRKRIEYRLAAMWGLAAALWTANIVVLLVANDGSLRPAWRWALDVAAAVCTWLLMGMHLLFAADEREEQREQEAEQRVAKAVSWAEQ